MLHPNPKCVLHSHVPSTHLLSTNTRVCSSGCVVACMPSLKLLWSQLKSIKSSRWPGEFTQVSKLRSDTYTFSITHIYLSLISSPHLHSSTSKAVIALCLSFALPEVSSCDHAKADLGQKRKKDGRKIQQTVERLPHRQRLFFELRFSRMQDERFVSWVCTGTALDNQGEKDKSEWGLVLDVFAHFSQMQLCYWVLQRYNAHFVSYRHKRCDNAQIYPSVGAR